MKRRNRRPVRKYGPKGTKAVQALKLAKQNRKQLKKSIEFKYLTQTFVGTSSATVAINAVGLLPEGTGPSERIGQKFNIEMLSVRGIYRSANSTYTNRGVDSFTLDVNQDHTRLMFIYDVSPNGALPVITEILDSSSVLSQRQIVNKKRFKILFDRTFGGSAYSRPLHYKFNKKVNKPAEYVGPGSAIADIERGSIFYVLLSASNQQAVVNFHTKMWYTDS